MATLVTTVGEALLATCEERLAQREVIEETLLFCLVQSSRSDRARATLTERLSRRDSLLDARRLAAV